MADDITLPGTAAVVATDDIGSGRQVQLVKPVFGADGSATMVSAATPLPVAGSYQTLTGTASSAAVVIASFEPNCPSLIITTSGTFTGTVRVESSHDGSTWTVQSVSVFSNGQASGEYNSLTNLSTAQVYITLVSHRYYRINCSAYTSGSLSVTVGLNPYPPHGVRALITNSSLAVTGSNASTSQDATPDGFWARIANFNHGFNGATWDRHRVPKIFKSITTQASGDTAVWTPTSGKRWQLLKFQLFATSDAAQTTGGVITVTLRDVTTSTGLAIPVYVPTTGGTALGGWSSGWIDVGPYGVRAAAINTALNVNLSAALTAGTIGVVACGTEE